MMLILCISVLLASSKAATLDKKYWNQLTQSDLSLSLRKLDKLNQNVAKNLVLIIGDGMGITTTSAARVLKGQRTPGMIGEEALLSWDKFPYTGLSKTYATDQMTTDSAASATAYHCGVKTKKRGICVDDTIIIGDCSTTEKAKVKSVLKWAMEEGKSVGIITTDAIADASPAAAYANSATRKWRSDKDLPQAARGFCKDIARQLVEDNLDIQVILGGGREHFLPNNVTDPEYANITGERSDGQDLMKVWLSSQLKKDRRAKLVYNRADFDQVDPLTTDYLMGLFEPDKLQVEAVRSVSNTEPSLAELTDMALKILQKNPKGFYLFVEEENVDTAHHENRAKTALEAALSLDAAVAKVLEKTSSENTLVVVTADHSHVMTFGGYARRGQSILALAKEGDKLDKDQLGNHYTLLSYGNGPGYHRAQRENLTDDLFKVDQIYAGNFPLEKETHGGEDVAVFASGPMAHLFTGVHEHTFIAHTMLYASCLGENKRHCGTGEHNSSTKVTVNYQLSTFIIIVATSLVQIIHTMDFM